MKPVSIKAQKIIMLIPGLNILCVAIFVYNSFGAKFTLTDYLRSWLFLLFPAVFVAIVFEIVFLCFPGSISILGHIRNYLVCLIVGLRLVKYQETYLL